MWPKDLAISSDRLEFVDDLPAHRTQIPRLWLERNTRALPLSGEIEEVSDDVLKPMHSAFDDVGVLLRDPGRVSDVLEAPCREQNRAERIANIVADDRQNPPFEVSRQGELLLIVLLLRVLRPAPLVNVYAATDEAGEASGVVQKRNTTVEDPAVLAS